MKRLFYTISKAALLGAAAFAVIACGREAEVPDQVGHDALTGPIKTIRFRAVPVDTRAAFGAEDNNSWPTLWTDNDTELMLSLNYGSAQAAGVTPSSDHKSASFSATIDFTGIDGPYTYYAVSPSTAAQALSPSREAWKVSIPCVQTPGSGTPDEGAIILASASAEYATASEAEVINLFFGHLTAYGCMSLENLALKQGETVTAVELTVTTPIVGDWYWKCSDGQLTDYGASSTLTLSTSGTENLWFGCAPVDVGGEALVVSVYTDQGVYEQLTAFPAGSKFSSGEVAIFSIDMDGADYSVNGSGSGSGSGSFSLVTDASTLSAGDEVLIVYSAGLKALGALNSSGNFRDPVDVSISNNSIASTGSATVLTLCEGSTSGTWAFKDGNNYLTSPSSSNNYLQNSTSVSGNSSWNVSITSAGIATLEAQAGSRTFILYNPSSPRFTCYDSADKSGMKKVSIYRRSGGGGMSVSDPMLSETEYGCYLGTGLTWTLSAGSEQVTRSYDADGVQTYTLIDPSEVEELEIVGYKKSYVKSDSFTVSVNWRKGITTIHSQSYNMTLIKEAGPKVWLSDGAGNGVIIKK